MKELVDAIWNAPGETILRVAIWVICLYAAAQILGMLLALFLVWRASRKL